LKGDTCRLSVLVSLYPLLQGKAQGWGCSLGCTKCVCFADTILTLITLKAQNIAEDSHRDNKHTKLLNKNRFLKAFACIFRKNLSTNKNPKSTHNADAHQKYKLIKASQVSK